MNTDSLPLDDLPPQVEITDRKTLLGFYRMRGMMDAKDLIVKLGFNLPGIRLAEAALQAEINGSRCRLQANIQLAAQRARVNFDKWCVSGMRPEDDKWMVDFKSMEQIDEELSKP